MKVEFGCPSCARAVETEPGGHVACPHCGADATLDAAPAGDLAACIACGCDELYKHRDFNQKLGIFLIVLGIVLCLVLTSFWPLVIAAVVDLLLYQTLPDVAICYRCQAHHRDFDGIHKLPAHDLERHEHYKFLRARAEGRIPEREPETGSESEEETP